MRVGDVAASVGKGLFAGLAGTAVMTVSSTLEANLSGRGPSSTPADALSAALGVRPEDEAGEQRLNTVAHWGYGTAWGAVRGLIGATGTRGPMACLLHFATVWGGEQVVLPSLAVGSPTPEYGAKATATDVLHHTVYAIATSVAYEWLERH
jgi:hypothetical protein